MKRFAVALLIVTLFGGCVSERTYEEVPQLSLSEIKNKSTELSYDELMRHNEDYVGDLVHYRAEVVQVMEVYGDNYVLRAKVTQGPYDRWEDTVWLDYEGDRVLEDDIVEFWGRVDGLKTYEAVLGNQITIPKIKVLHLELLIKG